MVALPAEGMDAVVKRLRRAQGQIGGILKMIEDGRDCEAVITQVAAASKAIDRAGFAIIATGLKECMLTDDPAAAVDTAALEKMFYSLI